MTDFRSLLSEDLYQGYSYGYPHKTAYRPLDPPVELAPHWQQEDLTNLFLYLHIPFCEMRCGFCNLFTTTHPQADLVTQYLQGLDRQMGMMRSILDGAHFSQVAFGGGTPSFLSCGEIETLFASIERHFGALTPGVPMSFETSPATVSEEKLRLLRELGVTRLSIGVQSFIESETRALGRPQKRETLLRALELIRGAEFPLFNIDLIYGVEGQSVRSWMESLQTAVSYGPQELYLYPLYVRPLTGLGRMERLPSDQRPLLYEAARNYLLSQGYEQISMRLFRHHTAPVPAGQGAIHCCQEDGMVGLGAGARSYTRDLHYSSEYAVGRKGILSILQGYLEQSDASFLQAQYGCLLTEDDRRRRYLIKSLLRREGVDRAGFVAEFGTSVEQCFAPELTELDAAGMLIQGAEHITLRPEVFLYSDLIGPGLTSQSITEKMSGYELT